MRRGVGWRRMFFVCVGVLVGTWVLFPALDFPVMPGVARATARESGARVIAQHSRAKQGEGKSTTAEESGASAVAQQGQRRTARGDINGDGKSDLFWRQSNGTIHLWLLNGGKLLQAPLVLDVNLSADWTVVSTGDFNGDGKGDLVWRHSNGETYLWLLNGGRLLLPPLGLAVMSGGRLEAVSTGDFNGDGKSDVVKQNLNSGAVSLWLLNNGLLQQRPAGLGVMPSDQWQVLSVGDFNGDRKSDLVWRNLSNRMTLLWLLNGKEAPYTPSDLAVMPSSQWEMVSTGDFNGDGKSDLVWRNLSNGALSLWLFNGSTFIQAPSGLAVMPSKQWEVISTGDFNGDGKSDLVWRNLSNGVVSLWLCNGGMLLQPPIRLGVMPSDQWEVLGGF
jgi:hypothetical protein